MDEIIKASQKAAIASSSIDDYIHKMIFFGFSKPFEMTFLANYGFWTGKTERDPERLSEDYKRSVLAAKQAFRFLADYDDDTYYLLWSYITRNINYFVQSVYDGLIRDSVQYRDSCADILNGGSHFFLDQKEGGTKHAS